MTTPIRFDPISETVRVVYPNESITIHLGDILHTSGDKQNFDVTINDIINDNNGAFLKLLVDVKNVDSQQEWKHLEVYNTIFIPSRFTARQKQNNIEFWDNLPHGHSSPHHHRRTKSASPLHSLTENEGVGGFQYRDHKLYFKNKHGIKFQIQPGLRFFTEVTQDLHWILGKMSRFDIKKNDAADAAAAIPPVKSRTQGQFISCSEKTCTINEIGPLGIILRQGVVIQNVFDQEFWQNMEIITQTYAFKDQTTLTLDGANLKTSDDHIFKAGSKFKTTINRPQTWSGFLSQRASFDFENRSTAAGTLPVEIFGKFERFERDHAVISIDFDTSEKVLMGVAVIAALIIAPGANAVTTKVVHATSTVADQAIGITGTIAKQAIDLGVGTLQVGKNFVANSAGHILEYVNYMRSGGGGQGDQLGGGTMTYHVPYDPTLPFWQQLIVTQATCRIAHSKRRTDVDVVHDVAEPVKTTPNTTTRKKRNVMTPHHPVHTPHHSTLRSTPRSTPHHSTLHHTPHPIVHHTPHPTVHHAPHPIVHHAVHHPTPHPIVHATPHHSTSHHSTSHHSTSHHPTSHHDNKDKESFIMRLRRRH